MLRPNENSRDIDRTAIHQTANVEITMSSIWCCRPSSIMASTGTSVESAAALKRHRTIETDIENERSRSSQVLKILLLGGPESGKSTIFKQMKILHTNGFSQLDLVNFRYLIIANVVQAMQQLLEGSRLLQLTPENSRIQADIDVFLQFAPKARYGEVELTGEFGKVIERLFQSKMAKLALQKKESIVLLDSAEYFFNRLETICEPMYTPSNEDVLRSRTATTGIVEMDFAVEDKFLKMIDVGGQRSERRKWIHCFDNVNGVLFIAELSGYNQKIDPSEVAQSRPLAVTESAKEKQQMAVKRHRWNRLKYSMDIFDGVASNVCFKKRTALIVFLNKADIFKEKLAKVPLTECFRDYKRTSEFAPAAEYVGQRFKRLITDDRQLYVHTTTATDTKAVRVVFESCLDVIVRNALQNMGFT